MSSFGRVAVSTGLLFVVPQLFASRQVRVPAFELVPVVSKELQIQFSVQTPEPAISPVPLQMPLGQGSVPVVPPPQCSAKAASKVPPTSHPRPRYRVLISHPS